MLHIVTLGIAYALFEMFHSSVRWRRSIAIALAAGIVTLLLCAIYLLPFLEAVPQTAEYEWRKTLRVTDRFESPRDFAELFFLGLAALLFAPRLPLRFIAPSLVLLVVAQRITSEGGVHKSFRWDRPIRRCRSSSP